MSTEYFNESEQELISNFQNQLLEDYKYVTGKEKIDDEGLKQYQDYYETQTYLTNTVSDSENNEYSINNFNKELAKGKVTEEGTQYLDKFFKGVASKMNGVIDWGMKIFDYHLTIQEGALHGESNNETQKKLGKKMMWDGLLTTLSGAPGGPVGVAPGLALFSMGSTLFTGYPAVSSPEGAIMAQMTLLNSQIADSDSKYHDLGSNKGRDGLPDPLAIDLDGDGLETVSRSDSSAYFDLDKNGMAEKTGWISGDDGILTKDINGDGVVNDSSELFGDKTALGGGGVAASGFQALGDLDSNKDGKISAEDDAFDELKIWQDRNQDGISQADEMMELTDAGIKSISLDTENVNSSDGKGNIIEKTSDVEFAGDSVKINRWYRRSHYSNGRDNGRYDYDMEEIRFADGTKWSSGTLSSKAVMIGDENDNTLSGSDYSEGFEGGGGDDKLYGNNGNDVMHGGEGNDYLNGGNDQDRLYGGAGNDRLYGSNGHDTLEGGTSNDYLDGGENNDTYYFSRGDGSDTIWDYDDSRNGGWSTDKLIFKDLNPEDIDRVEKQGVNLVIYFKDTEEHQGDSVKINRWYRRSHYSNGRDNGRYDYDMEEIRFADGTKWSSSELQSKRIVHGSDEADNLSGTIVNGHDGDDTITGTGGRDYLQGNKGNDTLSGGSGNDTYIFTEGDGQDTINDSAGDDTLKLGTESRNVVLSRMANDLSIMMKDTNDKVTVSNWFASDANKIETIETTDGSITYNMAAQLAQAMACFEDEKGITWTQAINENRSDAENILAAHWEEKPEAQVKSRKQKVPPSYRQRGTSTDKNR